MSISGEAIIGGVCERGAGGSFKAWDPSLRDYLEPSFHMVSPDQIDRACTLAGEAFDVFRKTSDQQRAQFLDTVAEQIMLLGDALIERAMAESGLPRVRLMGQAPQQEVEKLFDQAWLFVMPNILIPSNPEGLGLAGIEAAGAGVPVVASGIDGIPTAVNEGALLLPSGDAPRWISALNTLLADPERRAQMSRDGADAARTRFDAATATQAIHALLTRLVAYGTVE